jgi:UDP-N-acetylmuramoylalanine--D-glutamate ligase
MEFTNKSFLVLGAGISGISAANVLSSLGAVSTLSDAKSYDELPEAGRSAIGAAVRQELGRQDQALLDGQDYLVLSPGISIYHPLVAAAQTRGIPVVSEIEVAYHLSQAPIIAITGTNGKTTTTSLIGEMVKTLGKKTVIGGNIGIALSREVLGLPAEGLVVAEISSFQLEAIHDFRAQIAAVLNLTPDHIDRHRNIETYQMMKERIFANQQANDYTVLNFDDLIVREMAARTAGQVVFFSRKQQLTEGVCVDAGSITIHWQGKSIAICPITDINLRGAHNLENALAACAVAYLAGVKPADIACVLRDFAGVEHRIEPVAAIKGVAYFNDSKATNPESAVKALEAFSGNIILIAGGKDKNTDLNEFMTLVSERVDHLILIGEAAARFAQEAGKHAVKNIHTAESFSAAVDLAYQLAVPPQVVLLSPACASYDMFNNYEERGRLFKALVHDLSAK